MVDHVAAADQEDRREAELRQEADQRVVAGLESRLEHRLVEHPRDAALEAGALVRLAREGLDDAHAGDVLLGVRRQLADALLHLLEGRPCQAAVAVGDVDHERHRDQRDRGEPRFDREHRDRRQRDRERRLDDEHQSVAEEEADRLKIDCHARHQLAGLLVVEEGELERLELAEEQGAKVVFDAERNPSGHQAPAGREAEPHEAGGRDQQRELEQAAAPMVVDRVDRDAADVGDRDGCRDRCRPRARPTR